MTFALNIFKKLFLVTRCIVTKHLPFTAESTLCISVIEIRVFYSYSEFVFIFIFSVFILNSVISNSVGCFVALFVLLYSLYSFN